MHPIPRMIISFTILILLLSSGTLTPRLSPLVKLKVDVYAPLDPSYKEKCLDPFLTLQNSNYYSYLTDPGFNFDQKGVIKYNYGNRFDNASWRFPPYIIASFGIIGLNAWCQKQDPIGLKLALNQADYLIDHAVLKNGFATWPYDFPISMFDIPADFTSGFANGYVLVLFTQLHAITGDERFIEFARRTANSFNVDIKDGGVRFIMADGTYFFEEYAYPQAPTAHILNGHMAAVAALAYYGLYANDIQSLQLVDKGLAAVRNSLEAYDTAVYSLYDLQRKMTVDYAHDLHISYLFWMYRYTQDPIFLKYAIRWQNFNRSDNYPMFGYRNSFSYVEYSVYYLFITAKLVSLPLTGSGLYFKLQEPVHYDLGEIKPIGALNYYLFGSPATDYTISTSLDGANWQDVITVKDPSEASTTYCFDDLNARYIRIIINKLADQETNEGGLIRTNPTSFCQEPILLVTTGDLAEPTSNRLGDANSTTALELTTDAAIYGDLRQPKTPSAFILSGDSPLSELQAWVETSNDLQHWLPLISQDESIEIPASGEIPLPQSGSAWQYFRLHLMNKSGQVSKISIHTFSVTTSTMLN